MHPFQEYFSLLHQNPPRILPSDLLQQLWFYREAPAQSPWQLPNSPVTQSPKGQMQAQGGLLSFSALVGVGIVGKKNEIGLREGGEEEKGKRT